MLVDSEEFLALINAVDSGNLELIKLALACSDINYKTDFSYTALHIAVENEDYEATKLLLEHGAFVDAIDIHGNTPLLRAVKLNNLLLAKLLLSHKAKTDLSAMFDVQDCLREIECGNYQIAKKLVSGDRGPVDSNGRRGYCALAWVAHAGNSAMVQLLLENGAEVDKVGMFGLTPLILAARLGHVEIVKKLLAKNSDVNLCDDAGCSALLWAIYEDKSLVVKELLKHNPKMEKLNFNNYEELIVAGLNNSITISRSLFEHVEKDSSDNINQLASSHVVDNKQATIDTLKQKDNYWTIPRLGLLTSSLIIASEILINLVAWQLSVISLGIFLIASLSVAATVLMVAHLSLFAFFLSKAGESNEQVKDIDGEIKNRACIDFSLEEESVDFLPSFDSSCSTREDGLKSNSCGITANTSMKGISTPAIASM